MMYLVEADSFLALWSCFSNLCSYRWETSWLTCWQFTQVLLKKTFAWSLWKKNLEGVGRSDPSQWWLKRTRWGALAAFSVLTGSEVKSNLLESYRLQPLKYQLFWWFLGSGVWGGQFSVHVKAAADIDKNEHSWYGTMLLSKLQGFNRVLIMLRWFLSPSTELVYQGL